VPCGVDRVTPCGAEHCHHVAGVASRFITTELEALARYMASRFLECDIDRSGAS
jgi:hypothetical protein